MTRYIIFDDKIEEVQTVLADSAVMDGTIIGFYEGDDIHMMYNLPPGYSVIRDED